MNQQEYAILGLLTEIEKPNVDKVYINEKIALIDKYNEYNRELFINDSMNKLHGCIYLLDYANKGELKSLIKKYCTEVNLVIKWDALFEIAHDIIQSDIVDCWTDYATDYGFAFNVIDDNTIDTIDSAIKGLL